MSRLRCGLLAAGVLLAASCQKVDQSAPVAEPPPLVTTKGGDPMASLPAGWFHMGSDEGPADQSPAHDVWVDTFLIDRCEVTQQQYAKAVPVSGSHFKGPKRPVEMISWAEAAMYCNMRSQAEGLEPCYDEDTTACNFEADGYRLPTEAEWEYACRAGSRSDYSFGDDAKSLPEHAWYAGNAAKQTHPAGEKKPNAWGLFDMHGNVAEWCNDAYGENYYRHSPQRNPRGPEKGDNKVLRGGAWTSGPESCRSAYRVGQEPGFQDACFARDAIGFRCVRKAPGRQDRIASAGAGSPDSSAIGVPKAEEAWPKTSCG
jgi:formylglycine-generating enzyme required for sulfatase activity